MSVLFRMAASSGLSSLLLLATTLPLQASESGPLQMVDRAVEAAAVLWPQIDRFALVEKSVDATVSQTFAAQPIFQQINTRYPKADLAAKKALRPLFNANAETRVQEHLTELAQFYRQNFSADELDQLLHFWRASTGQKLLQSLTSGGEFDGLVKAASKGTEKDRRYVADAGVTEQAGHIATNAVAGLTDAEVEEYTKFAQSKVGRKYRALAPQRIALTLIWANKRSPEFDREASKVLIRSVNAHIDTFPKRAGDVHIRLVEPR